MLRWSSYTDGIYMTPTTSLRLDPEVRRQVVEVAPGRSLADVIREALALWLAHRGATV